MRIGYHVVDLQSGEEFGFRSFHEFPLASVVKLPLLFETLIQVKISYLTTSNTTILNFTVMPQLSEGRFQLDSKFALKDVDKCIGSGEIWKEPE